MHTEPRIDELISALRHFISETAMPHLSGHAAFHAKVALNAVDLVQRDLASRSAAEQQQVQILQSLLNTDEKCLSALETELCAQIRDKKFDHASKSLMDYLLSASHQQMAIDQPRYSGYQESLKRHGDKRFVRTD